jgi:hypothetical protein
MKEASEEQIGAEQVVARKWKDAEQAELTTTKLIALSKRKDVDRSRSTEQVEECRALKVRGKQKAKQAKHSEASGIP